MNANDCANCGATLAGPWCSRCGQHARESVRSVGALLHDAWHSLTHLDGRIGQTLRQLFLRPGSLTTEYLAGRRARYVPPFRLYLVCSLLFFALAAVTANHAEKSPVSGPAVGMAPAGDADGACRQLAWGGQPPPPWLTNACLAIARDQGAGLGRAFLANAPKMMFVLLPALAAVMQLFWWRPRRLYVEHLVFSLHTHAFVFSLFSVLMAVAAVGSRWATLENAAGLLSLVLWGWALVYPWLAMRRHYGQSRRLTAFKFVAIAILYVLLLSTALFVNVVVSALTLAA
jgi:Protein of unknown function (DUF3667)